jgi:uncharacterized protein YwgA
MSREGAMNLIAAVAKAMGRAKLDVNNFEDRLLMQKGCFILNEMGVVPKYTFGLYIRGPYSTDLTKDYYEILNGGHMEYGTDVPSEKIKELSDLMSEGASFVEAYATLRMARIYNPRMDGDRLIDFVVKMKPHLEEKIKEASKYQIRGQCVI